MADLALLLDAQDLIEIDARNRRESGAFAGRRDGVPHPVLWTSGWLMRRA
jgi:hypothetical protein